MYNAEMLPLFRKKMGKLLKKDRFRYERVKKKSPEICNGPHHHGPLGNVMAGIFHVHIDPYVLTFEIDEANKVVRFHDFDNHDKIYKN